MSRLRRFSRWAFVLAVVAIAPTCEPSNILAPTGARQVQLQYVGDSVIVLHGEGRPQVRVLQAGSEVVDPELTFASADTTILALGSDGELIGLRRGTVYLRYLMSSALFPRRPPLDSVLVRVVAASLSITGDGERLTAVGDALQLTPTLRDALGEPISDAAVAWSTDPADGALRVSAAGVVTALAGGVAEVVASIDGLEARARITVAQEIDDLAFEPSTVLLESFSASDTVRALALDRNGNPIPDDPAIVTLWTSRDTTVVATRGDGIVTAVERNDDTWVIAERPGKTDSLLVRVRQRAKTIEIQADPGAIATDSGFVVPALYGVLHLRGVARDSLGREVTNAIVRWEIANPSIVQRMDSIGTVQGVAVGATEVLASMHGVVGRAWVEVRNDPASVTIPTTADTMRSIPDELQFTAAITNSLGDPIAGATPTWSVSNATVAAIDAGGRASALAEGQTLVIATAGSVADTARLTVRNYPDTIDILLVADTLWWIGDSTMVPVRVRNATGAAGNTAYLTWESRDPAVAAVSSTGVVRGLNVGSTWILATFYEGGAPHRRDSLQVFVTNDPISVVASAETDTLTLPGQQLRYSATARNAGGDRLSDSVIVWRSSAPGVAAVDREGGVTAMAYGVALIIAEAGPAADTITVTVHNPTMIFVDNSAIVPERLGSQKRPFARIQDAVTFAEAFDTVFVRRGFGYSETVALSRRITVLGDSSAFVSGGRDPSMLPRLAHDSGSAGILAHTTAAVTIAYLRIVHSLDGPAIDTRGGDVQITHVHVNPGASLRVGQGIRIARNLGTASIRDVRISAVRGYGIRLDTTVQAQLTNVQVDGVDSLAGIGGEGIHAAGGDLLLVAAATVRRTRGPQLLLDGTVGATVTNSDLAGRARLIVVRNAATEVTRIEGNTFDLTRDPAATDLRGSADDGRAGVEIRGSRAQLRTNTFVERGTALMDAVRLVDARGGGAYGAVELTGSRFTGGRSAVRSERSSWTLTGARLDSATIPIVLLDADSVQLVNDTLFAARQSACVDAPNAHAVVVVSGGLYQQCGIDGTTGGRAVRVSGSDSWLTVADAKFVGPDQTAIEFTGAGLTVRRSVLSGAGPRTVSSFVAPAAIHAVADEVTLAGNSIHEYAGLIGASIDATSIRADSNRIWLNGTALRFGSWTFLTARDNDVSDQETAGIVNASPVTADLRGNWWGDGRGPRRDATPQATGDSAVGPITFDPVRAAPGVAGTAPVLLRKVRGDGQSGPTGTVLPKALTIRLVDAASRPVAGALVTFQLVGGGGGFEPSGSKTITVTTDASGLAEGVLRLSSGTRTIHVSSSGVQTITFTATGL